MVDGDIMAYTCANCGSDNDSPRALAAHMLEKHDSPFLEGDERLIGLSADLVRAEKNLDKKARLVDKFAAHGRVI